MRPRCSWCLSSPAARSGCASAAYPVPRHELPCCGGPGKLCTAARHRLGCSSQGVSLGCRAKHTLCLPPRAAETEHSPACKHAGTRFCTGSSNECGSGESAAWYSPSAASTRPVRSCDTASSAGSPRHPENAWQYRAMDSPLSPSSARKEAGMFLTLILLLSGRSLRAMAAQSPQERSTHCAYPRGLPRPSTLLPASTRGQGFVQEAAMSAEVESQLRGILLQQRALGP
ncbi:unnamed protein product [Caretta caretta]